MATSSILRIWCNAPFNDEAMRLLRDGTSRHELMVAGSLASSILRSSPTDEQFARAEIAFGQPDPAAILKDAPKLRWAHLSTAGYTRYDRPDFREGLRAREIPLTTSSHVFNEPCAQHLAAMLLALARQLPQSLHGQWNDRPWPYHERRLASRLLGGETVLLYGYGAIAERLSELLEPYRMRLVGVRRQPRGDEPIEMIAEAEADRLLPEADHVIDILPENASTQRYFGAERFRRMKRGARFYNIGRGPTVDQPALIAALADRHLDAAYLDVTDPEPLPPEHPLWSAPNCYICPHTGGGHREESVRLVRHFLANLERFEAGEALIDRVM
jgi:phosphoglycerate dehydrogenase-like enzyme